MKLKRLRIDNFRALKLVEFELDQFTCLIGANGAGKSTVFAALNLLFRNSSGKSHSGVATPADYFNRDITTPITITAEFGELSTAAKEDLAHYVRQDKLVVQLELTWDSASNRALARHVGIRNVIADFAPYFAKESSEASAAELKDTYKEIRTKYPALPEAKTKQSMRDALREYEEKHPELTSERKSHEDFYGVAGVAAKLLRHLVWIHVPAVKDAADEATERGEWIGQLVQHVVRSKLDIAEELLKINKTAADSLQALLDQQREPLETLSKSLTEKLKRWANPDAKINVEWAQIDDSNVKPQTPQTQITAIDGSFHGSITQHGHGFQRSYLVALLQELAASNNNHTPAILLGIEEPELYQHPPQARYLANTIDELTKQDSNTQIVICTHSPYFASGRSFEHIRLLRKNPGEAPRKTQISHAKVETVRQALIAAGGSMPSTGSTRVKLHQQLTPSANELFFASIAILVEGTADFAYITAHMHLSGRDDDFRRLGCQIVVAERKSNLATLLAVANALGIPTFVVFDSDSSDTKNPHLHSKENTLIARLQGHELAGGFPVNDLWKQNLVVWKNVFEDGFKADFEEGKLDQAKLNVRQKDGLPDGDIKKSALFVGAVVEELWELGYKSSRLEKLCDAIINFARSAHKSEPGSPVGKAQADLFTTPSSN